MTNSSGYWYRGCWCAASQLSIDYDHPALLYGASIFTTMRRYQGDLEHPLTMWAAHRDRLQQSITALGWVAPDWSQVLAGIAAVTQPIIRIAIFPQGEEFIFGRELPADLIDQQQRGVTAQLVAGLDRSLPQHKTGNYLAPWLAKRQAGCEAILVDSRGRWLETSTGSLWGWDGQDFYSPAASTGILPGIARDYLVQWLQSRGKIVNEQPWDAGTTLDDSAQPNLCERLLAVAYSNCGVQLVPIKLLRGEQDRHFDCQIWEELRAAFGENRQKTS
jgi:branched-subunit amino acid aminotransferase/4-amino-4-deoxychorismate lyase